MPLIIALAVIWLIGCGNSSTGSTATSLPAPRTAAAQTQKSVLLDVLSVAGKPQAQVDALLGTPSSSKSVNPSGTNCPCPEITYQDDGIEIIYIDGVANWITINDTADLRFDKESLSRLGLPVAEPSYSSRETMRWDHLSGIRQIEFFPEGDGLFYVFIKTAIN